ncbi:DNA cytosine methyltransferase [Ramlibacter sp. XY19]|uniref:DNA cytosine methyltransferase n=1 Tax=Ramlibacter paludis TaxID=2908000 RepID=UPI0023DCA1B7|nr:DNA cytosine methyltransferase [Ramlibacter paludis]MCG2594588.1 DNA cytosine methyltransferase [Ramlibacter paludis]
MNTAVPIVVDLFAGAGGMSAGFVAAGFRIAAALESIPVFAATHKANFESCTSISQDITTLTPKEFAVKAGVRRGEVDMIIGGPPCQPFSSIGAPKIKSLAGSRVKKDERKYLVHPFLEYVEYFSPRAVLIENVPQLRTKDGGKLFDAVLAKLSMLGYSVSWSQLNAVHYGVPQARRRLFIAALKGRRAYHFPAATHALETDEVKQLSLSLASQLPPVTVKDALEDLPKIQDGARLDLLPYSKDSALSPYQIAMRGNQAMVGNNVCRVSNDRAKQVFRHMLPGMKYMDLPPKVRKILPFREDIFHDRLKRLHPDRPSWTVLAHIGMDGYMYIHPWENRTLSVREAARIQSFPDSFRFVGNMREQYVQVGNAVPPLLAQTLAEGFFAQLGATKVRQRAQI